MCIRDRAEAVDPAMGDKKTDTGMDAKQKRVAIMKRQILQRKMQAVRGGAGADIVAHNELEGEVIKEKKKGLDGKKCWDGYKLSGTKKKGGKIVDNCVKEEEEGGEKKLPKNTIEFDGGATIEPVGDSREIPTLLNLVKNKLRARGLNMSYEPKGEVVSEKKADKDYDGDGKVESGKDEYFGSKDKAIKKAMGKKHDCASKVKHEEYGLGDCIKGMHDLDESGNVAHYDVLFEHGVEKDVDVSSLEILEYSMHEHVIVDGGLVDEAMSSYDKNRKAAAKRAADRNAARRRGELGGRMENETYRNEAGTRMHHKGYKAEEVKPMTSVTGDGSPLSPRHSAGGDLSQYNKDGTKKTPSMNKKRGTAFKGVREANEEVEIVDEAKVDQGKDDASKVNTRNQRAFGNRRGSKGGGHTGDDMEARRYNTEKGRGVKMRGKKDKTPVNYHKRDRDKAVDELLGRTKKKEPTYLQKKGRQVDIKRKIKSGYYEEAYSANPAQQAAIAIAKKKKKEDDMVAKKKKEKMYAGYEPEGETIEEGDKKGKGSGSKDACYHKVKSRYSVWPSAYASGALVKCRKVGAANWGNSSKKEDFSDWKAEFIWEDGDSAKKIEEASSPAWQRKEGKSESGGLNKKGVASYRAANPGSKLKTAVTAKPSTLKRGSKSAKRRKSFCSRMKGMKKKLTSAKTARDPDSRINKALRKWNC